MLPVTVLAVVQMVGNSATTVGVLTALFVVLRDERRYRADQRQARGDQARLVAVEFDWDEKFELDCGIKGRSYVAGIVRNFSSRPILDVAFEVPASDPGLFLADEGPFYDGSNTGKAQIVEGGGKLGAMYALAEEHIEWDRFRRLRVFFTDANGVLWTRTQHEPPKEVSADNHRELPS
jgi:hypothetical protein